LPDSAITIKIGSSVSEAKFYLRSVEETRVLLQSLSS
jgi:hypothetical protein